jgi:ubiquitin carboxyl-terminal hydrolase 36/42
MMVQDPARVKKVKPKVVSEGGSLSRHQGVQLPMTNDISHTFDDYGDPAESPSPSESSSLFSNSDAGSHSTESSESTRNSTSTEEYEYLIFGTSDQMYPGGPMTTAEENNYTVYSCSRSSLNASSSRQESGLAERYTEHRLQGTRGGWVEGDEGSSFLYTDRSRQQLGSKLTEHHRQLDGTGHDPGETRGSNLSRRKSAREKTTRTFY